MATAYCIGVIEKSLHRTLETKKQMFVNSEHFVDHILFAPGYRWQFRTETDSPDVWVVFSSMVGSVWVHQEPVKYTVADALALFKRGVEEKGMQLIPAVGAFWRPRVKA